MKYLIQMADMGYGLTREAVMHMVYVFVEKCKRDPILSRTKRRVDRGSMGLNHAIPTLQIRIPQPLSYCRALCCTKDIVADFFGKLGAIYGKQILTSKPMQIFNSDETGVSIVRKPGKVVTELGRHNVYSITSAERGKTHTILTCVSASGFVLPPCLIYPRKKSVPANLREGAIPGTLFCNSESGWVNKDIYLEWFQHFLRSIPLARPVLLFKMATHHMSQLI